MIEFAFTLDYEIYGNGTGRLRDLVYEPTKELISVFKERDSKFVVFAEALEFKRIEEYGADDTISEVRDQLRRLHDDGFEIGLHLHPWWFNARHEDGCWHLDWTERNLCVASVQRANEVVGCAINYLRDTLVDRCFTPTSFRNGLWLMQPTQPIASVLLNHGVRIDSSVFKGGYIQAIDLDYRPSLNNSYFWLVNDDVNLPDPSGRLLEIPIYTEMVPFWKMLTQKRLALQRKAPSTANGSPLPSRFLDFARLNYPRKVDFCRMTYRTLQSVIDEIIRMDRHSPQTYKIIVAIGHSKDLIDFDTVRHLLSYLDENGIPVVSFHEVLTRIDHEQNAGKVNRCLTSCS
jgi:hypothetical protein